MVSQFFPSSHRVPLPMSLMILPDEIEADLRVARRALVPPASPGSRQICHSPSPFTARGQAFHARVVAARSDAPLRVTLVWTEPSGHARGGNELALEVIELATGGVLRATLFADAGPGCPSDRLHRVDTVHVAEPTGAYEVRVTATALGACSARGAVLPQPFDLVFDNAAEAGAVASSVALVVDRSASMEPWAAITRAGTQILADRGDAADRGALVSFGTGATVELSLGTAARGPASGAALGAMAFGGESHLGRGLAAARGQLANERGHRGIAVVTDGYEDPAGEQADPSMASVLRGLPAGLPIHACAVGATSAQAALQQLALESGGRYFHAPAADDLFEVYNYLRAELSGESVVANESVLVTYSSVVGAPVDASARRVCFTIAWTGDVEAVEGAPRDAGHLGIRLRDPTGATVRARARNVTHRLGRGFATFEVTMPRAGRWLIELATTQATPTRCTVGALVDSPVRLVVAAQGDASVATVRVDARVDTLDPTFPGLQAVVKLTRPKAGIPTILRQYACQLGSVKPATPADGVPEHLRRLAALRDARLAAGLDDLFAVVTETVFASPASPSGPGNVWTAAFRDAPEAGSYTAVVTAQGVDPRTGDRIVRKAMATVVLR